MRKIRGGRQKKAPHDEGSEPFEKKDRPEHHKKSCHKIGPELFHKS